MQLSHEGLAAIKDSCVRPLDHGDRIGVALIAASGFISILAILFFFGIVSRNVVGLIRDSRSGGQWRLINSHIEAYLLSLLSADLLTSIGGTLSMKWFLDQAVTCNTACNIQGEYSEHLNGKTWDTKHHESFPLLGALQIIGPAAVALSTLAVAIHTFLLLFFQWSPRRTNKTWVIVVGAIWSFVCLYTLFTALVHDSGSRGVPFFTPAPVTCWVNSAYVAYGIGGDYALIWLAAVVSLVLYSLLFFRLRGNIHVHPDRWSTVRFSRLSMHTPVQSGSGMVIPTQRRSAQGSHEAMKMLWYPLCYIIVIVPLSVVRWQDSAGPHAAPFAAWVVAECVFKLSGLINVILFLLTRPNLLLLRQRHTFVPSPPPAAAIALSFLNADRTSRPGPLRVDSNVPPATTVDLRDAPLSPNSVHGDEAEEPSQDHHSERKLSLDLTTTLASPRPRLPQPPTQSPPSSYEQPPRIPIRFPSPTISFMWDNRPRGPRRAPSRISRTLVTEHFQLETKPVRDDLGAVAGPSTRPSRASASVSPGDQHRQRPALKSKPRGPSSGGPILRLEDAFNGNVDGRGGAVDEMPGDEQRLTSEGTARPQDADSRRSSSLFTLPMHAPPSPPPVLATHRSPESSRPIPSPNAIDIHPSPSPRHDPSTTPHVS